MRPELRELCNNFIQNRDTVKEHFFWTNSNFYPIAAAIFTDKRVVARGDQLMHCKNILETETGIFSNFQSYAKLAVIAMLATNPYPEVRMKNGLAVYEKLKDYFWHSSYLPVAAMIIVDMVEPAQYDEIVVRTRHIYELMRSNHPFLTAGEDSVFAAMLALSPLSDEQVVEETERCYRLINPEFLLSGDAVQSLSHVLALCDGDAVEKCSKTMALFHALKENGCKYGTSYELATLGVLAMLPVPQEQIIKDFLEVDEFLQNQKGYGFWGSITKRERYMHVAMLVTSSYVDNSDSMVEKTMSSAAISSTISLVAAQQAAMCAAIAASNAASNAANN